MARLCSFLLGLCLAICGGLAEAQEVRFDHSGVASDAKRYEAYLRANWPPRDQRAEGGRLLQAGDARAAANSFAEAVVLDANDTEAWSGLARALLAITPDQGSERYELPVNASAAAWFAYQRGQTATVKAAALVVLHEALKRRSYWRPAIEALKASLSLVDDVSVRETYDKLVAEHGFRILEYKVEADSIQPRLCIQFSERLAPGTIDWAEYFKIDGKDPQAVAAEAQQICVDGLSHGKHYEVQVRAGLPSAVGEKLRKTAELAIYVRDRTPSVRAAGRGYLLPNRGQEGIPLVTVNTEMIKVEVLRIGDRSLAQTLQSGDFQKQISSYELEAIKERTGARVFTGEMPVTSRLNEDVTTAFPIAEAVPHLEPGVYVLAAFASVNGAEQSYRNAATQWFIISDLGLTAISGEDGLHAFVRSLAAATAVVNANLRLIARNNEVLGTAKTDSRGYAHFAAGLTRGEGGLAPAVLAADTAAGDYAFLDLATAAFDLTDRGVKGRAAPGPIDAFAFTERGIYRPGEEVHLTALARDSAGRASSVPLTVAIARPDGVEHARNVLPDQGLGGRTMALALPGSAMTGTWRVKVYSDPKAQPIAQAAAFLVEDFVPERLELKLEPTVAALGVEEAGTIKLTGRYLYGPPAVGLAVEGEIAVRLATGDVEGLAGYRFGLADEPFAPVRMPLERLPTTDAEGKADIAVRLPALPKISRPLQADVILKLRESGGRTIERTLTLPVDQRAPRIGLKPLFTGNQVQEGTMATVQAIMLGSDGKPTAASGLKWELVRLDQRWQWYSRDGSWSFEPVTTPRRIAAGTVDAEQGEPARIEARVDWGRYRLEVSAADGSGAASSLVFNAGFWADEAADSPEMLDVALDKASYRAGETARVRIASRTGGRALIAILTSRLVGTQEVELPPGGGDVPIRVGGEWDAGAYVTVMLYRPLDAGAKRMPSRALGLRWLAIDQAPRTLRVDLEAPDKVRSGSLLTVPVRIAGLAAGEEGRLTLAAVDVGILNVTRFEAPKPEGWFFGQRRIGSEIRDVYGRLIDGMRAERGRLRSGGDGSAGMSMQGTPPVEETLALFSGIVKAGPDGDAKVELQLPDFNGTVRLSAVAWTADKLGSASKDVIVRDPVALTASAPRFLTLGDDARLELALHNVEGPAGAYTIRGEYASDAAPAPGFQRAVTLAAGERRREAFHLKPDEIGLRKLSISISGPDGIEVRRRLSFDVKVPAGDIRRLTVASLAPGSGKITLNEDLLHDLIAKTARVSLSVGPAAGFDVPGLIVSLDRYPHGCAEQTTSRALPLLYVNEVAKRIGLASDQELRERVQGAIDRVFEMQDASGAFGTWGPHDGDMWLTSYVTEFLTRAKELGYAVRAAPFEQALARLENYLGYVEDFESGGEERAYALYVLARNGRAPIGELRYYVDTRLDRFATPLARAQLGAALAMLGDRPRAEKAMAAAFKTMTESDAGLARRDYGTGLRDGAGLITLASETGIDRAGVPRLVDIVAKAFQLKAYTSTQEQAWLLLAARALGEAAAGTALTIDGRPHSGPLQRTLAAADLQRGVAIANAGDTSVDAVVSVIGAALTPEPAVSKGITLERTYYTLDGRRLDLKSAAGGSDELKQNDRLVVSLKIEASEAGGRLVLVDRLPAGLEIENPRLVDAGDVKTLDWLKTTRRPEHAEFRDDRFVAAFDFFASHDGARRVAGDGEARDAVSSASVAYVVRAVTPGSFVHPAASVEDMYRPDRFARTASGRLLVK